MAYDLNAKIARRVEKLSGKSAEVKDSRLFINGTDAGELAGLITEAKLQQMIDAFNQKHPDA
jgi:hypothetical protein